MFSYNKENLVFYVIIIFFISALFSKFKFSLNSIIGTIIGIIIIIFYNYTITKNLENETTLLWNISKSPILLEYSSFVTDIEMIKWVKNSSKFKEYSIINYNKCIKTLNMFLILYNKLVEYTLSDKNQLIDKLDQYKLTALHYFHAIVFQIKDVKNFKLFKEELNNLNYILSKKFNNIINNNKYINNSKFFLSNSTAFYTNSKISKKM